jgi:cell division protein FtsB
VVLAVVTVTGIVFVFGFPVRTLLGQRHQVTVAQTRIKDLSAENAKLAQRAAQLQTDAQIRQIARQDYGLVMPGEHAYAIVPPVATTAPPAPLNVAGREHPR